MPCSQKHDRAPVLIPGTVLIEGNKQSCGLTIQSWPDGGRLFLRVETVII